MQHRYAINLFWSDEDDCWIANVPDLKYCSAHGDTPVQAATEIEIAIKAVLEAMRECSYSIPEPKYDPNPFKEKSKPRKNSKKEGAYNVALIRKKPAPPHPGEILLHDFLKPMKLSPTKFSKEIGLNLIIIKEIIQGKYDINPEIAETFSKYFGTSAEWWIDLQRYYDVEVRKLHWVV